MAARTVKESAYVYALMDGPAVVYVGKGTGARLKRQKAKHRLDGVVLEACDSESAAFQRERDFIEQFKPPMNIGPGGNGGRRKKRRKFYDKAMACIDRIGTRAYSARLLINIARAHPHLVTVPMQKLREVAFETTG